MKTNMHWKYSNLKSTIVVLLSLICAIVAAQDNKLLNKTFEYKQQVNGNVKVFFDNYNANIKVTKTTANEVVAKYKIIATANDEADISELDKYMSELKFELSAEETHFYTDLWKNLTTTITNEKSKIRMNLKDGKIIRLKEFELSVDLYIPEKAELTINSKYAEITLDNIYILNLTSFDDDITAANVSSKLTLTAKYSDIEFNSIPSTSLDLFDCDIAVNTAQLLNIKTKYSDIDINVCTDLSIESFDDDFNFQNVNNLSINAKYSDFRTSSAANVSLILFDCNIKIDKLMNLTIGESKYSELKFGRISNMVLKESYDDKYKFESVNNVQIGEMKYSDLDIEQLNASLKLSGYDNSIDLSNIAEKCTEVNIDQKYGDLHLSFPENKNISIDLNAEYGELANKLEGMSVSKKIINDESSIIQATKGSTTNKTNIVLKTYSVGITLR